MSWESYEKAAEKGPVAFFWKILWPVLGIIVVIGLIGYFLGWFSEATRVAQEEFGPRAALEKYEWFIDQANRIEKMDQDIILMEKRLNDVDKEFESLNGADKVKWSEITKLQYSRRWQTAQDDLIAVVSQRNNLVREYNASSEKFNWALFQTKPDKPKERFHEYTIK